MLSGDHAKVDTLLHDALDKLRGGSPTDALNALDLFWARLAVHIRAEHFHLFPAVLKLAATEGSDDFSHIPETLESLRRDHDFFMHELAAAIKAMRAMSAEDEAAVRSDVHRRLEDVRDRLVAHNAVEEESIYPLRKFFSPGEDEALLQSIERELQNLPPRLANESRTLH